MATAARRPRKGPLLFVPVRWQRVAFLTWLKRVHAWTGVWGALIFLGLGVSGVLLNHRALLKIDTGTPREVSSVEVSVAPGRVDDVARLDAWTKATFHVPGEGHSPPPPPEQGRVTVLGSTVTPVQKLERTFTLVDGRLTVATVRGSGVVAVRRESIGWLSMLKNMHKGTGLGIGWILFIDAAAGALITMSVTGTLLWSRLHGSRIAAAGLLAACLIWACAGSVASFAL